MTATQCLRAASATAPVAVGPLQAQRCLGVSVGEPDLRPRLRRTTRRITRDACRLHGQPLTCGAGGRSGNDVGPGGSVPDIQRWLS